jgi:hypothetical protein
MQQQRHEKQSPGVRLCTAAQRTCNASVWPAELSCNIQLRSCSPRLPCLPSSPRARPASPAIV